jgi:hypothetical protein
MDSDRIQDRIHWGLNVAARAVGSPADAYRPRGAANPLDPTNRYLRLHAAFGPPSGNFERPSSHGSALCYGYFDGAYTQPGDYLVQKCCTVFIAEQRNFAPILCVRTNRTVSFRRSPAQSSTGQMGYGGIAAGAPTMLLERWPASVLGTGGSGTPASGLHSGIAVPIWTMLMPALSGVMLLPSDLMSDELGQQGIVLSAELSHLGWRLTVKQLTT